jgi:hypothetical protein
LGKSNRLKEHERHDPWVNPAGEVKHPWSAGGGCGPGYSNRCGPLGQNPPANLLRPHPLSPVARRVNPALVQQVFGAPAAASGTSKWYRGEGVGVNQAMPGETAPNDILDGMYFTDQEAVAGTYAAKRASEIKLRRVYELKLDTSKLRILDLTNDPRWKQFISTPLGKGRGTLEDLMKLQTGGSTRIYAQTTKNFIEHYRINVSEFDGIIGHEYLNGGRQLCILYKKGGPTPLHTELRKQFVAVGLKIPVPKTPKASLRWAGKIGPGLKLGAAIGANLLFSFLMSKIFQNMSEDGVKRQWEKLLPEIERQVKAKRIDALRLFDQGLKAFAVVRVSVTSTERIDRMHGNIPGYPLLGLESVVIQSHEISGQEQMKEEEDKLEVLLGGFRHHTRSVLSIPLGFSDEELSLYRSFAAEIRWYDTQIAKSPIAVEMINLVLERSILVQELTKALED